MGPEVIALSSMAASGAGGAMGFFSSLAGGKSQSEMYKYKAGIAQLNQKIALQNRDWALQTGEYEAMRSGLKTGQQLGSIKAAQSASGINVNTGSATDVQESQHKVGLMDMDTIRTNAARAAYGYSVDAAKSEAESGMYMKAAKDVRKASYMNAIGSLISGTTSVSSKWLQARDAGIFGKTTAEFAIDPNAW